MELLGNVCVECRVIVDGVTTQYTGECTVTRRGRTLGRGSDYIVIVLLL